MTPEEILQSYNLVNRERLRLLEANESLNEQIAASANSKIGRILHLYQKIRNIPRRKNNGVYTPIPSYRNEKYQKNESLGGSTDIKAIAFYLPQFHTFPENDAWWGKGFTEWTNVKKASPRFQEHYQPRVPDSKLGYYSLTKKSILKKQIKLAKEHHIFGFCFYYYWFSGKRLMEKPVDMLLADKSIDFPFCLCWANENWTRRWDGQDKDILIKQDYKKDDPKNFIIDIKKYLLDERYIRVNGKPVILIYKPDDIPDLKSVISTWRRVATEVGIGEIEVWTDREITDDNIERLSYVDAEFDFAPHGHYHNLHHLDSGGMTVDYRERVNYLVSKRIYDSHLSLKPFYYSATMAWDNSPRKANGYFLLSNYSSEAFYLWLKTIIAVTRKRNPVERRFIFINAWNEWAEGTYLEPDARYGYTNINTLTRALLDKPLTK